MALYGRPVVAQGRMGELMNSGTGVNRATSTGADTPPEPTDETRNVCRSPGSRSVAVKDTPATETGRVTPFVRAGDQERPQRSACTAAFHVTSIDQDERAAAASPVGGSGGTIVTDEDPLGGLVSPFTL